MLELNYLSVSSCFFLAFVRSVSDFLSSSFTDSSLSWLSFALDSASFNARNEISDLDYVLTSKTLSYTPLELESRDELFLCNLSFFSSSQAFVDIRWSFACFYLLFHVHILINRLEIRVDCSKLLLKRSLLHSIDIKTDWAKENWTKTFLQEGLNGQQQPGWYHTILSCFQMNFFIGVLTLGLFVTSVTMKGLWNINRMSTNRNENFLFAFIAFFYSINSFFQELTPELIPRFLNFLNSLELFKDQSRKWNYLFLSHAVNDRDFLNELNLFTLINAKLPYAIDNTSSNW